VIDVRGWLSMGRRPKLPRVPEVTLTLGEKAIKPTGSKVATTLSIDRNLLDWIDSMVHQVTFGNRSHGVEFCIARVKEFYEKTGSLDIMRLLKRTMQADI
jgi:hypothetical protein